MEPERLCAGSILGSVFRTCKSAPALRCGNAWAIGDAMRRAANLRTALQFSVRYPARTVVTF
jgi:hypothetical protein